MLVVDRSQSTNIPKEYLYQVDRGRCRGTPSFLYSCLEVDVGLLRSESPSHYAVRRTDGSPRRDTTFDVWRRGSAGAGSVGTVAFYFVTEKEGSPKFGFWTRKCFLELPCFRTPAQRTTRRGRSVRSRGSVEE